MIVYGAWQSSTDTVRCLQCRSEFVTDAGRRCPDCFPEDHLECYEEFGPHDHDPEECERILWVMNGGDTIAYMEAEQEAYSREAEEASLGRPLFPNEY